MPDSGTESKSKQTILLSRLSVILPVLAGVMLFALLVFLGVTANFEIQQSRKGEGLERDTYLSFYTVHQYAEVYIDGQLVYSMKPSGKLFTGTIGSNWSMIPLCREDAEKEIRVNIIPVYESFRNREV